MNTSKNKIFKVGDVVAFNFTEVKTPMKITKILNNKHAALFHRDLNYDCGMIDMQYLEPFKKDYEKEYSSCEAIMDHKKEDDFIKINFDKNDTPLNEKNSIPVYNEKEKIIYRTRK